MTDYAIIYNPYAAAGKAKKQFDLACATLDDLKVSYELHESEYMGHAIELAKSLAQEGYDVIGAGGDGTCNEVLNGVMKSNTGALVGFIPMGTGNDIPGAIGIKPDVKRACELISERNTCEKDVGESINAEGDTRYFLGIGSQGFDAEVTKRTNEGEKKFRGTNNYVISVLKTVFRFKRREVKVTFDNETFHGMCNLVAVGNGPSYGGWMYMCPEATLDDGLFHISIVNMRTLPLLINFNKLYDKSLHPHPDVKEFVSKTVKIEMANSEDEPYIGQVDGEIIGNLPITYNVLPNGYEFICPTSNECDLWFQEKYKK